MVLPALNVLRRLIDAADGDSVKLAAVKDILDRAGLKPADLLAVDNQVTVRVSYADAPQPWETAQERATATRNGHQALNEP